MIWALPNASSKKVSSNSGYLDKWWILIITMAKGLRFCAATLTLTTKHEPAQPRWQFCCCWLFTYSRFTFLRIYTNFWGLKPGLPIRSGYRHQPVEFCSICAKTASCIACAMAIAPINHSPLFQSKGEIMNSFQITIPSEENDNLWEHQKAAIKACLEKLRPRCRIMVQMPTGSGKNKVTLPLDCVSHSRAHALACLASHSLSNCIGLT